MKKLMVFSAMMASLAAFAGSAEPDGTDFVVTASAGESFTNSTTIGNYARLVKRGAGEVVLTAATTAFVGEVLVEEGTLAITDLGAVGAKTPVTVESGATFYFKTPHSTSQTLARFTTHVVTISGDGVDDKGAIRFLPPDGAGYDDSLLGVVNLAADATIECDYRWGVHGSNSGKINLNGHTLRRIWNNSARSGDQWMINNATVAGGGGTIEANKGRITFQGNVKCSADTTFVSTNSSNYLLWGVSGIIPSTFKFFPGQYLYAFSGTAASVNHISGPVYLLNHAGSVAGGEVTVEVSNNNVLHLDGPFTGEAGTSSTTGTTYCRRGTGRMFLNGDVDMTRNTYHWGGGLTAMTSTATRVYRNGFIINEWSEVLVAGGHTHINWIRIGNGAHKGLFRQTGGVLGVRGNTFDGESNGSIGHWVMTGGEAYVSNSFYVAANTNSFGGFRQTGGLFKFGPNDALFVGRAGTAVYHQSGGTNITRVAGVGQAARFTMSPWGGISDATVSGEGTLLDTETLSLGGNGHLSTNTFTLRDGATLKATRLIRRENALAGTLVCVNVDGGIIMPVFGHGWSGIGANSATFYSRNPDHFTIWGKGMTIDTSESSNESGGQPSGLAASYMPMAFEAPTGKGVETVSLPTDAGFIATNYHGIARVVFESATGYGATAYAEFDHAAHKVTHIVVTSRGCNYGDDTKAYLENPTRSARYACALTLTSNEGQCGELVKRGAQILYLYATNTITGGIAVESGTLYAGTTGVVPSNTPVRVESGATLQFSVNQPAFLSTFTGAGNVTGCDITVTNAVRATCAQLFANKHATFAGNLTFAPGATFTITDPENLTAYAHSASATAFTAASVNGTPTLAFEGDAPQGVKWSLFKKNATSYNFGPVIGTMLLLK